MQKRGSPLSILFSFKLGLLVFWGTWYLIAFSTNLCDIFQAMRVLPQTWRFASGNLQSVIKATSTYPVPRWLPRLLFFGVLGWQCLAWFLFGWAVISSVSRGSIDAEAMNAAFVAGVSLWAAFMIADELFKQYETEHVHVLFLIAQVLSFAVLHVSP
jgi:hypothetical protein